MKTQRPYGCVGCDDWICTSNNENSGKISSNIEQWKEKYPKHYKWRASDDDKNLLAAGLSRDLEFWPLDDWLMADYGAVSIEYWKEEKQAWEYL